MVRFEQPGDQINKLPSEEETLLQQELDREEAELNKSLNADSNPVVSEPKLMLKPAAQSLQNEIVKPTSVSAQMVSAVVSEEQRKKLDKLNELISSHEKNWGKGIVRRASDDFVIDNVDFVPCGVLPVDAILGGGFARGRIYELFGPEGSGKTSLALKALSKFQKAGLVGGYIDAEHALDQIRCAQMGVDLSQMNVWHPDYGEQALDMAESVVNSGAMDCLIIDSVAALVPKKELDGEMGDSQMGEQARMMGKALRKLKAAAHRNKCTIIFINQIRYKVGIVFGNPEVTPGGKALPFLADVRIDIRRREMLKNGEVVIGQMAEVKTVKNKLCPPFQNGLFATYYDERGIDEVGSVLEAALQLNVIEKAGNWYNIPIDSPHFPKNLCGNRLGHGLDQATLFLQQNKDVFQILNNVMVAQVVSSRKHAIERLAQAHRLGTMTAQSESVDENDKKEKKGRGRPRKEK